MNIQTNINRTQHNTYSKTTQTTETMENNNSYNYDDTGSFDANNISQHRLCDGRYMHVNKHSYILCIPRVPYSTTKMEVAIAVENQLLTLGMGNSSEIYNFEYVQNVTFIRAFDQVTFEQLTNSKSSSSSSSSSFSTRATTAIQELTVA